MDIDREAQREKYLARNMQNPMTGSLGTHAGPLLVLDGLGQTAKRDSCLRLE